MKKIIFVCFCTFYSVFAVAQSYRWQSAIDTVPADGFYKILIPPGISTHLKRGFPDLRIFNGNEEVSYLLKKEEPSKTTVLFKEYDIISKDLHAGGISYITLRNKGKNNIDNIDIEMRNSDVIKKIKLTGSDDQKEWYMIKDDYEFYSAYNLTGTSEIKILNFPLSNYEYYRLEINDKKSRPINILKAGYYDYNSEKGKYTEVPAPAVSQADSVKKSFVRISFPSQQYIDQLKLEVAGPAYYLRQATLFEVLKDSKNAEYLSELNRIELSSGNSLVYDIRIDPAKTLLLQINNEDNAALKMKSVKAFQLNNYCIAYLSKGKNYVLRYDNEKAAAPVYDLQYFNNKIPADIKTLTTGLPESIAQPAQTITAKATTFFTSPWFIWSAICAVVVLLAFMTTKMLREMDESK